MNHRPWGEIVNADTWPTLTLLKMLFHEASTASPAKGDQYVSSWTPATNEMDAAEYERQEVTGMAATWSTDRWVFTANTVSFGELTSARTDHAARSVLVYLQVGDGTDDGANLALRSWTIDVGGGAYAELTGEELAIQWHANGVARLVGD